MNERAPESGNRNEHLRRVFDPRECPYDAYFTDGHVGSVGELALAVTQHLLWIFEEGVAYSPEDKKEALAIYEKMQTITENGFDTRQLSECATRVVSLRHKMGVPPPRYPGDTKNCSSHLRSSLRDHRNILQKRSASHAPSYSPAIENGEEVDDEMDDDKITYPFEVAEEYHKRLVIKETPGDRANLAAKNASSLRRCLFGPRKEWDDDSWESSAEQTS